MPHCLELGCYRRGGGEMQTPQWAFIEQQLHAGSGRGRDHSQMGRGLSWSAGSTRTLGTLGKILVSSWENRESFIFTF